LRFQYSNIQEKDLNLSKVDDKTILVNEKVQISVILTDITDEKTDAIVNSTNK